MVPDKNLVQRIKNFRIKKRMKSPTKHQLLSLRQNSNVTKASVALTQRNFKNRSKLTSKLNGIINMCDQQHPSCLKKTPSKGGLKLKIPDLSRINSHFDNVYNTITNLDTDASSALENMFKFKKEEIQENEQDNLNIVKEYRKYRLSPDPKIMQFEIKKNSKSKNKRIQN